MNALFKMHSHTHPSLLLFWWRRTKTVQCQRSQSNLKKCILHTYLLNHALGMMNRFSNEWSSPLKHLTNAFLGRPPLLGKRCPRTLPIQNSVFLKGGSMKTWRASLRDPLFCVSICSPGTELTDVAQCKSPGVEIWPKDWLTTCNVTDANLIIFHSENWTWEASAGSGN